MEMDIWNWLCWLPQVAQGQRLMFQWTESSIPLHTEHTRAHQTLYYRIMTLTFYIFNKF